MTVTAKVIPNPRALYQKRGETLVDYNKRLVRNALSRRREATKRADPANREALNAYNRERYSKNKEANRWYHRQRYYEAQSRVEALKDKPCMDCGNSFPPECMDFDHRPGEEKLFAIGMIKTRSWAAIQQEVAKCDLVCANCHRIRTTARKREHRKVDTK